MEYLKGNLVSAHKEGRSEKTMFTYNLLEAYQDALALGNPLGTYSDLLEELGDFVLISSGYFGKQPKNLLTSDEFNTILTRKIIKTIS